ncbi:hypothetical protein Clacol_004292 [Clathrus columnatus]|uniref:Major facilitator superfamily (MFS) profile domain-containing protein n=1 Tax=Clathrus columnatus TaxID=1419009 RepID=A0AAV5A600_9AGAM|nr:hypothetical protein Clacol_004292 [Clathrus columnatus]
MAISTASFGMTKTFLAMILTRCIGGAMGSVWAVTKTLTAEYTDSTNQAKAFQFLTIAYRSGQILGLPLGGLLAHPNRNYSLFQSTFWIENPFALPCFIAAGASTISVTLGYFILDETLKHRDKSYVNSVTHVCDTIPVKEILTSQFAGLLLNIIIMSFVSEVLFALFPLFSFTPVSLGGMGVGEATIGLQMSARAFLDISLMFFYSTFERCFGGALQLYRITMFTWPVALCCMPVLHIFARIFGSHSPQVHLMLFVFFITWGFCGFAWSE